GSVAMGDDDADELAVDAEERGARAAGVDAFVGLNQAGQHVAAGQRGLAAEGRDDTATDGVDVAMRMADGDDVLADPEIRGRSESERGERLSGLDADGGEIVRVLGKKDVARDLGVVGENDGDGASVADDVPGSDDQAPLVDNDAGADDFLVARGADDLDG